MILSSEHLEAKFYNSTNFLRTFPPILASWFDNNVHQQFVGQTSTAVLGFHFQNEVVLDCVIKWLRVTQNAYIKHSN